MIKTSQSPDPNVESADSGALQCWGRDAHAESLRIELADQSCFVFPYGQFVHAQLSGKPSRQTMKIGFASHAVNVTGSDLLDVLKALQKLSVEWMRETPARYAPLVAKGAAKITKIVVEDLAEAERM